MRRRQARNKQACQRAPRFPLSQTRTVAPLIPMYGQTPKKGVAKKNHNLKAAKAKNFCKTLPHRKMNKEFFSDFGMNK